MDLPESPDAHETFIDALSRARTRLRATQGAGGGREPMWPVVVAALLFAVCSLSFATAAILAPPVQLDPISAPHAPASAGDKF